MAETRAHAALKESTLREVFHYGIYINRLVNISITAKPENEFTIDPHFVSRSPPSRRCSNHQQLRSNVIIEGFGWFQWVNKS
ncbi:unnamed protein product, partial [Brassica oleracea]